MAILCFVGPLYCGAQNLGIDDPSKDQDVNYYQELDTMNAVRHAFKFDPVQIFFGDFQFYYEHMWGSKWSLEIGLGPSRRNFTASMFDYELDNFGNNIDVKTRYAASFSVRRYFWDTDEMYGPYLALSVQHRRHDKTFNVLNSTGELSGFSFDDSRRYTGVFAVGGYQIIPLQSNIFFDLYFGAGLRYRDFEVVRSTDLFDPEAYSIRRETSWKAAVLFGAKIGFGF